MSPAVTMKGERLLTGVDQTPFSSIAGNTSGEKAALGQAHDAGL
jgi:hypothetical protein